MKMKICPCCDQPIERNYCKGCRKIVLKPLEQDVDYYLNTRHPDFEHACTYHEGQVAERMSYNEIEAKKREIQARMMAKKNALESMVSVAKAQKKVEKRKRTAMISLFTMFLSMFIIGFTFVMIIVINMLNGFI